MQSIIRNAPSLSSSLLALLLAGGLTACVTNDSRPAADNAGTAPQAAAAPADPAAPSPAVAQESKPVCPPATKKTSKKSKKSKASVPVDCVPATATAAPAASASGAYDLSKNKPVTDSTKVESGQGTQVKGINEWQGEISGVPARNSRFTRLKIGMSQKQVTDLIGEPTDQGAYVTGKAFIPFYFGSDKSRWEMVYKGQGRLIFSNQAGFGSGYYLTWVIHNGNEGGYR